MAMLKASTVFALLNRLYTTTMKNILSIIVLFIFTIILCCNDGVTAQTSVDYPISTYNITLGPTLAFCFAAGGKCAKLQECIALKPDVSQCGNAKILEVNPFAKCIKGVCTGISGQRGDKCTPTFLCTFGLKCFNGICGVPPCTQCGDPLNSNGPCCGSGIALDGKCFCQATSDCTSNNSCINLKNSVCCKNTKRCQVWKVNWHQTCA
jgi:hypothetical protein